MITLEEFSECDFDQLISWVDSEELMIQFAGPTFLFPITHEQLKKYVRDKNGKAYSVKDVNTGEIIGHAGFGKIDLINRSARIGRVLVGDRKNRSKGYGKQIILKLVEIGFNKMNLHRIDLGVFDFNTAAIKCYQACGFEIEGLLRDTSKVGDKYWSVYNMSIINPKG